ncbi:MAG: Hsp20/alpha crystallin family protein [Myxococcota bacterium]
MSIRDLAPWNRGNNRKMVRTIEQQNPFSMLHQEMNALFDDFALGLWGGDGDHSGRFEPKIDISESKNSIEVVAEVPGLSENDIRLQVSDSGSVLTIQGEKSAESKDSGKNYHRVERTYGSFCRSITLPASVDADKAEAKFKNGELRVSLPKLADDSLGRKQIPISAR